MRCICIHFEVVQSVLEKAWSEGWCFRFESSVQKREEEKLDWFMDSITETIYEYTKQHCKNLKLLRTLTYSVMMANLYKLTCFEKYPHFHVKAQGGTTNKTLLTNNSLHSHGRGRGKGFGRHRSNDRSKGDTQGKGNRKGRGRHQSNANPSRGRDK